MNAMDDESLNSETEKQNAGVSKDVNSSDDLTSWSKQAKFEEGAIFVTPIIRARNARNADNKKHNDKTSSFSYVKGAFEKIGGGILGLFFVVGIALLAGLFIEGGLIVSEILYPWIAIISLITFVICLVILFPLALFKRTRELSILGLLIASYVFGFIAWIWSFLLSYTLWGSMGLFIGLFLGGIGVVPIALLATAVGGYWLVLGQLVLLIVLKYAVKALAAYLSTLRERISEKLSNEDQHVHHIIDQYDKDEDFEVNEH
jgi:hypothetical protein